MQYKYLIKAFVGVSLPVLLMALFLTLTNSLGRHIPFSIRAHPYDGIWGFSAIVFCLSIGTDHAGFGLKEKLVPFLKSLGYEVEDKGAFEYNEKDDYPDFVIPVAKEVAKSPNQVKGIVLGATGQGEAMVANRFRNVRAVVYYGKAPMVVDFEADIISRSREHNNANILSLGARFLTEEEMMEAAKKWLETAFIEEERHARRLHKIDSIHD